VQFSQGFFTVARPCERCGGEGRVVVDPCVDCDGEGRIEREREIEVTIPPGVDTGARLRLRSEGEHGRRGGPDGDLYVDLMVEAHPHFERQGRHVVSRVEISYPQAVLGTTVEVETLHGSVTLDVPPGTAHGAQFRLPRKGVQSLNQRGLGDQVVVATLRVPEPGQLDGERLELLKRLAELEGEAVGDGRGVLGRVRDLFG
jgi:molecular chaperone DnaJ